jgi:hypothetical protein
MTEYGNWTVTEKELIHNRSYNAAIQRCMDLLEADYDKENLSYAMRREKK